MSEGPPVPFSALPLSKTHESTKYNAWGAYGPDDERGFLNRQTDAIVAAAAASEIKTGARVNLNATMDFQVSKPLFARQPFVQNQYQKKPRIVHDDTWSFNTQSSTQWDGLRHFGYQKAERFYNDTTLSDIAGTSTRSTSHPHILGIQNLASRGVVGRGVLIDIARWLRDGPGQKESSKTPFSSFDNASPITLDWLQSCLSWQGTQIQYGDILFVRSGFFPAFHALDSETHAALQNATPPRLGGVEQSEHVLRWIWEHFSAVASDHPSFEAWPANTEVMGCSLHEVLLAGWGCPIGELFELEELAKKCAELGRWSFFVTSEVVNVPGGVASPANALAIF